MQILEIIFWISFAGLIYTYVGYPLILMIINFFIKKPKFNNGLQIDNFSVSFVIAAYNEADFIIQKINNLLHLQLPEQYQIICVTDGSTDGTDTLVKQTFNNVLVLHQAQRNGKAAAINRAMPFCNGQIIIFSDANTWLNPFSINKILRHFNNPKVGAVAGEKRIVVGKVKDIALYGESLYWHYEAWIKKNESDTNLVVGAAGELFAMRKNLFKPVPENFINEDFVLSVSVAQQGYKVKYEPNAYAMEYPSATLNDEMNRKVRIATGSFQLIGKFINLFNGFKYGLLSWQYISRKFLRWTVCPIFLITTIISNIFIVNLHNFYLFVLCVQALFYILAFLGYLVAKQGKKISLFISPFYFVFMHVCQILGFFKFINGIKNTQWIKVKRVGLD
jgi:poly-beta-1,6-N-acetyl-D-glucosamine synthase